MEFPPRKRNGLMSETLYAGDLLLTSETMEGLREKWKWKEAFESKGLKVKLGKTCTKVVVSGAEGEVTVSKVDPCGVCGKRVMVKFRVMCEMQEMDPWKMRKSKEGDPEVGERFCVCKMQEAS